MNLESIVVLILVGAILVQIAYDYYNVDRRCVGRDAYEKQTSLQKTVLKIFLPILPFITLPIFSLLKDDIFEYTEDVKLFFTIFLLDFIAGPAIVYACFGNFKASFYGFAFRGLMLIVILKIGW